MSKRYQYLFFDLDGTLTDPREGITQSVRHALRHFGIEETDTGRLEAFIGPPLIDSFMHFYAFTRERAVEAVHVYRERYAPVGIFENRVLDGIPELLEALREDGRIMTVTSSKPEPYVLQILEEYDLFKYFTVVTGSTMQETRTSKEELIEETCRRLGILEDPEELRKVLMIGDREHDILGAKAFGVDSMGVYFGFAVPGELESAGATLIAHTVEEMKALLLG